MVTLSFPRPPLVDEVVALRPWRRADIPQKFAGLSDSLCLRFSWSSTERLTEAHIRRNLEEEERERRNGKALNFAVVDVAAREHVLGGAALYDVDGARSCAAVGYWLAPHARGRGVSTRTVRLLAGWGFERLALARLELTCGQDNTASQRVAERCGFTREGVLRSHLPFQGGRCDTGMLFRQRSPFGAGCGDRVGDRQAHERAVRCGLLAESRVLALSGSW